MLICVTKLKEFMNTSMVIKRSLLRENGITTESQRISKNQDHKVSYTTMVNKLHDVFGKKNIKQNRYEMKNMSNSSESDKEDNELLN